MVCFMGRIVMPERMVMSLRTVALVAMALFVIAAAGAGVRAAHDGNHGPGQSPIERVNEKLHKIDAMLSGVQSTIGTLTDRQAAAASTPAGQMAVSVQALLGQMRQLQGVAGRVAGEPGVHDSDAAMGALEKACRDLEKMTSAFQSLAKNVSRMNTETRQAKR
jgi:hypothetical protein